MRLTLNYTGTVPGDGAAIHTNVYALIISDRLYINLFVFLFSFIH